MLNKISFSLLLAFLLSFNSMLAEAQEAKTRVAVEMPEIRFCVPNNMVSALVVIARTKGYFADEGVTLAEQKVTNAKISNDLLLANKADMSVGGDGPFEYISFSEHPLRILAETHKIYETAVFARKDKGIAKEEDLKGKKIGYLPGTVSYLYFAELMDKHGWNEKDFTLVPLQPPAMPQALVGGSIDAFVMWEPWGYNAQQSMKDNVQKLHDRDLYHYLSVLIGRQDYIDAHPKEVRSVIKALLSAEKFVQEHKDEAIAILAKEYSLSEDFLKENWDLYSFHVGIEQDLLDQLVRYTGVIAKHTPEYKDKKPQDLRSFIVSAPLKDVEAGRVSLK